MFDPLAHWPTTAALVGLIAGVAAGLLARRGRPRQDQRRPFRWPVWVALVATGSFAVNVIVAARRGVPEPRVHDEFSYLLASDTFARGRLANPTPPAPAALQTFHVLLRPTYASKYPPGQGLCLALGQVTTGLPIVGAWLATAALVAAVGWAVAGFTQGAWPVGAAAVVALHPQVVEWSQTYWGGSVAATGGAFLIGAWCRLARPDAAWRWRDALLLGLGLGVLANSRPYEGLTAALPAVAQLLVRRPHALVAAAITLGPILVCTCIYNDRVTGSPWTLPYLAYERQYAAAPPLLIGSPRPVPADIPAEMRDYAEQLELPHYRAQRTMSGWTSAAAEKLTFLATATLPSPWLWIVAALVPWAVRTDRRLWGPACVAGATIAATLASNWTRTQYVAPAAAAVVVLATAAAARWVAVAPRAGRAVVTAAAIGTALLPFGPTASTAHFQRGEVEASLGQEPGRQLVLVRYQPDHRPDDEWVYNDADPPSSKIVWARDAGDAATVRAAYPGRAVWHLDVGGTAVAIRRD